MGRLLVSRNRQNEESLPEMHLIASNIEAKRLMEEELSGLEVCSACMAAYKVKKRSVR